MSDIFSISNGPDHWQGLNIMQNIIFKNTVMKKYPALFFIFGYDAFPDLLVLDKKSPPWGWGSWMVPLGQSEDSWGPRWRGWTMWTKKSRMGEVREVLEWSHAKISLVVQVAGGLLGRDMRGWNVKFRVWEEEVVTEVGCDMAFRTRKEQGLLMWKNDGSQNISLTSKKAKTYFYSTS